ncbi:hypothetical protein PUN28_010424 [Cardiocondyla obscurior]|uniref:Uncharacterized protein n=1 Tax=Cardiocondyla obscurior TaxID=286306 RepID=A0AAW2FJQ1_9HYME
MYQIGCSGRDDRSGYAVASRRHAVQDRPFRPRRSDRLRGRESTARYYAVASRRHAVQDRPFGPRRSDRFRGRESAAPFAARNPGRPLGLWRGRSASVRTEGSSREPVSWGEVNGNEGRVSPVEDRLGSARVLGVAVSKAG